MKNGLFCLALASGLQCFSMQPEMPSTSDKNLAEQSLSYDEEELARQRRAEKDEEILQNLSIPLSRSRPLPNPGIEEFYKWTFREFRSWVYANLSRVSMTDIEKVFSMIYSNMYEALDRVGDAYIPAPYVEEVLLGVPPISVRSLSPDEINSLGEEYHKLAEDCLMTMIERVGQSPDTQGRRYLLAALKRLFFLRFHPEMIGKEFRPGYLSPGDDPEVMCRGGYGTWCRREYD